MNHIDLSNEVPTPWNPLQTRRANGINAYVWVHACHKYTQIHTQEVNGNIGWGGGHVQVFQRDFIRRNTWFETQTLVLMKRKTSEVIHRLIEYKLIYTHNPRQQNRSSNFTWKQNVHHINMNSPTINHLKSLERLQLIKRQIKK